MPISHKKDQIVERYEARVGQLLIEDLPDDLYVPPAAFAILLEAFEGPLDFLLYLVRKNGFDLRKIDIAPIAEQYLKYIEAMQQLNVELAGDYMVMAALLADIKSRLLLPKPAAIQIEEDPRHELLERLETYALLKDRAGELNQLNILEKDVFAANAACPEDTSLCLFDEQTYEASLLLHAMQQLLKRPRLVKHQVKAETVSLGERINSVKSRLQQSPCTFYCLINADQGRIGLVVTFIAILELLRQQVIKIYFSDPMLDIKSANINTPEIIFELAYK